MKKNGLTAALSAAMLLAAYGCKGDMASQIAGTYEHPALPGQTFEFRADGQYMNIANGGDLDCRIKYPGTWEVDGDSLFITSDIQHVTYEFGDSVPEASRQAVKDMVKKLSKDEKRRQAFRIAGVDDQAFSLETTDRIVTYTRVEAQ